jgi:uncharacterized membrane protein YfcA
MEFFGYLASVLMGLSLGLMGGGGAILTVPILVYLFKIPPVMATGYSLFIVGMTALVGTLSNLKSKRVDLKTAILFGIPSLLGVYLSRSYLLPAIPREVIRLDDFVLTKDLLLMLAFASLMILASVSMIKNTRKKNPLPAPTGKNLSPWQALVFMALQGVMVGGVTGFVGAGGGFLIIPALVLLRGLPMQTAVGTSLMIIAANSLFGFLRELHNQNEIPWTLLWTLATIAFAGIIVGSGLTGKIDEKRLKKAFGYFILLMGSFILIQQLLQTHS